MSLIPFTCPDCGETFMLKPNGNRKRCPDCSAKAFRRQVYEYQKRKRQEKREGMVDAPCEQATGAVKRKESSPPAPHATIAEILAEAKKQGLTYGQYVARRKL